MAIRSATEADLPRVIAVWRAGAGVALGRKVEAPSEAELLGHFRYRLSAATPPFGFWVYETDAGEVVGWQSLMPFENNPLERATIAESSTYVARDWARSGVGEALLRHAMVAAEDRGLTYVFGFVVNEASVRLVEKCGWHRVGDMPAAPRRESTRPLTVVAYAVPA
jgi:L-amino acid N-acyltransferase YncA